MKSYESEGINLKSLAFDGAAKTLTMGLVEGQLGKKMTDTAAGLMKRGADKIKDKQNISDVFENSDDNEEMGKNNMYYLLPIEELDEVDKKALYYAEKDVEKLMYRTQHGIFGEYSIIEYSYGYLYKQSFENKAFQSGMWNSGSNGLQMGASIYTGVKTTPSSGYKIIDVPTIAAKASIDYNEPNPTSVGNVNSLNPYDDEALENARKKMEVIDSSPYKYVIYASGPRKKYIEKLDKQIEAINSMDIENDRYKRRIINYIESIKNLNINYEQSEKNVKFLIKSIDDMYR